MKFVLHIDCDNAAFEDGAYGEVARILGEAAIQIEQQGRLGSASGGTLRDLNGNRVGGWWVEVAA